MVSISQIIDFVKEYKELFSIVSAISLILTILGILYKRYKNVDLVERELDDNAGRLTLINKDNINKFNAIAIENDIKVSMQSALNILERGCRRYSFYVLSRNKFDKIIGKEIIKFFAKEDFYKMIHAKSEDYPYLIKYFERYSIKLTKE